MFPNPHQRRRACASSRHILAITCLVAAVVLSSRNGRAQDEPPHVAFLIGESEYGSARSMPKLANEFAQIYGARVSVLGSPEERGALPNLDVLDEADALVLFLRFRMATDAQVERLDRWFEQGKPVVAFRTTSHAFWERKGWFPQYFGGHYKAHADNREGTTAVAAPNSRGHEILRGVAGAFHVDEGGTYNAQPLSEFATPLYFGKTGDLPSEPVAWIAEYRPDQRLFYTSLGAEENFENENFRNLALNSIAWAVGAPIPEGGSLERSESAATMPSVDIPPTPKRAFPEDATILFDGSDLSRWRHWDPSAEPKAIGIDERADSTVGGPVFERARWTIRANAALARPGFGDILTKERFGDSFYELDFLIPESAKDTPQAFRGASGVYIDGRWELQIVDSHDAHSVDDTNTLGAIVGMKAPDVNAAKAAGEWQRLEVAVEHVSEDSIELSAWLNGVQIHDRVQLAGRTIYGFEQEKDGEEEWEDGEESGGKVQRLDMPARAIVTRDDIQALDLGEDFTISVVFHEQHGGPLFAMAPEEGEWEPDGKTLFIDEGRLVYDIGWLGEIRTDAEVADGETHRATVVLEGAETRIYVDGELAASRDEFSRPDNPEHVLKVGSGARDFPEFVANGFIGEIESLSVYDQALDDQDIQALAEGEEPEGAIYKYKDGEREDEIAEIWEEALDRGFRDAGEEDSEDALDLEIDLDEPETANLVDEWTGPLRLQADFGAVRFANIIRRPLDELDHASVIRSWDDDTLASGAQIYNTICITCHGDMEKEGSLPTSRKFWEAEFKNGKDPYKLYLTLRDGYGQMPAFPFLTPKQRYDVIHYIRETLVKPSNPEEYFEVTDAYLTALPRGLSAEGVVTEEMAKFAEGPVYERMNFGPSLNWTLQVEPGNIAYKGIAIRLDQDSGGVSKGRAWMLYDHDTMRVATAWTGDQFVDWRGIAFDQSHGTHTSIVGEKVFVNPVGPGWANPETGTWDDNRFIGRDGKPYGPISRDWAQYKGHYLFGSRVVLEYRVGKTTIFESPGLATLAGEEFVTRTLNVGPRDTDLVARIAPAAANAAILGAPNPAVSLQEQDGFLVARFERGETPIHTRIAIGPESIDPDQAAAAAPAEDLNPYVEGGPRRWDIPVTTQWTPSGDTESAYVVDSIEIPNDAKNPWNSWMRIGGFDYLENPDRAAVCTWLGDVWLIDGLNSPSGDVHWKRIASGLFQPLGVKLRDGRLFVTCRDQLVELIDLNGDEEIDRYRCFNNDHQVTEHFHEFAMGLQTDDTGNFYYAKSARHALPALVAHHGTLLKVSADGETTEILANGFRAANGVLLNEDGSFFVTDQEGHWTPKNRINRVVPGGFYGNMMGYHNRKSSADEDMNQPMVWVTNAMDRSPGELVWVRDPAQWGPLQGALINLSYGTGRIFVAPHEEVHGVYQGGVVQLPIPDFPTGVMRGRFHPQNGQLYACGMFAWAGNKHQDGGFFRVRYTGRPFCFPIELHARQGGVELHFTEPLDPRSAIEEGNYSVKIWDLERSKNYGSRHINERELEVPGARVSADGLSVFIEIPDLEPTWGMEIQMRLRSQSGASVNHTIHNTIHELNDE